jgi:hypothetical protein
VRIRNQGASRLFSNYPLALFVLGACSFLLLLFLPSATKPLVLLGGLAWACAYFGVVADNFKRKAPVHTRGGLLKYEHYPHGYFLVYAVYIFFGAVFLIVFLGILLSS